LVEFFFLCRNLFARGQYLISKKVTTIMDFDAWEPFYLRILDDFGFSPARDEEAARLLSQLLHNSEDCLAPAATMVRDKAVTVCGNAPSLEEELGGPKEKNAAFIAADGAAAVLLKKKIVPDIIVTDLDGPFQEILDANQQGSIVVVHAHGDNMDAQRALVPRLKRVIGTAQCRPPEGIYNFGGFTDGDRCVFLAKALGAASIELVGFDFDDPTVTPRKSKKLAWAKRLIDLALSSGP
jgi:uncharacterized Rossmann fold enzyme